MNKVIVIILILVLNSCIYASNKHQNTSKKACDSIQQTNLENLKQTKISEFSEMLENNKVLTAQSYKDLLMYCNNNCDGADSEQIGHNLYLHFCNNREANDVILSISKEDRDLFLQQFLSLSSTDIFSENKDYTELTKRIPMFSKNRKIRIQFNKLKKEFGE